MYTSIIYGHIKDKEYKAAAKILERETQKFPRSRAALSLIAFCYYHDQDFVRAANAYEKLTRICPTVEIYRLYHLQAMIKAGLQLDMSTFQNVNNSNHSLMIQLTATMEQEDLNGCKAILNIITQDDPETIAAQATLDFKEGNFEESLSKFSDAFNIQGYEAGIAYNIALCHYMLQQHSEASEIVAEIIDRGADQIADLDLQHQGDETYFIENSSALQQSYLVEAYNLKAAIDYDERKLHSAKKSFTLYRFCYVPFLHETKVRK